MQASEERARPENGELERWIRVHRELTSRRGTARTHWESLAIDAALDRHERCLAELLAAGRER